MKNKKILIIIVIATIIVVTVIYKNVYENKNLVEGSVDLNIENSSSSDNVENTESAKEENKKIIVHVAGEVNKEGVYELEENSRISDAINMAGGLKESASTKNINLAEILEDGSKIYIPNKNEESEQEMKDSNDFSQEQGSKNKIESTSKTGSATKSGTTSGSSNNKQTTSSSSKNAGTSKKVNINTATQTELESIPGVGPSTAQKIITYRTQKGKFKTIEDIKNVSGIGESKFNKMKDYITV